MVLFCLFLVLVLFLLFFLLLCILDDCNFVDRVVTFNNVGTLFNYMLECLGYLYGFLWPFMAKKGEKNYCVTVVLGLWETV